MPRNGYRREFSLHFSNRSMNSWSEPELPRYMLLSSVILESRCRLWWAKPRLNRDSLIIWLMNLERFELFPFFTSMSAHIKLLDNTLLSYIFILFFLTIGPKGVPPTSRRFSKCRGVQRGFEWLQLRQIREAEAKNDTSCRWHARLWHPQSVEEFRKSLWLVPPRLKSRR